MNTGLTTDFVRFCRFQAQHQFRRQPPTERERVPADVSRDSVGPTRPQWHLVQCVWCAVGQLRVCEWALWRKRFHGNDGVMATECC